ncbi:ADP-ribosylglycohydrolase family protein [Candidatus Chlorohelix sp.]|uniref:ADP-ribosylglycohydrolase family protein n=1 Tax=Candidatus Chlorohelix sp. TaxID=3139201 RepID=UPI0030388360
MTILFYHNDAPFYCFANFSNYGFELDGHYWQTSEHYFQAQKFVGTTLYDEVRNVATPRQAYNVAQENKDKIRQDWGNVRDNVMRKAVRRKFEVNPEIRATLLGTQDEELIEASPKDDYWGWGAQGIGQNKLGKILMEVREELRSNSPAKFAEIPIPASYWVKAGQFLAGEYPGAKNKEEARAKLQNFLKAGINYFLDLTEEKEQLSPYSTLLNKEASKLGIAVEYKRLPVKDVSIPTHEFMVTILDTLDAALQAGKKVYVHCWGGIGRTGTVVGCYLARHGMSGDEALAEVRRLFKTTSKSHKDSPEIDAQRKMVRTWQEHVPTIVAATNPTKEEKALGCLLGLICGDALGSTVEFTTPEQIIAKYGPKGQTEMRGGGAFNWQVGDYTDDGQMMLMLLENLVATNNTDYFYRVDTSDLATRFVAWLDSHPKDIGNTTYDGISRLKKGVPPEEAGDDNPDSQANGAVMRSAPVAVLWHKPEYRDFLVEGSLLQSYPTHRSRVAAGAAVVANVMMAEFINGSDFDTALAAAKKSANAEWKKYLEEWDKNGRPHRGNSGWAVSTVLTALHCIHTTASFEEALVKAVNGGSDADTVGAVAGAIAGALYGINAIPDRWKSVLKDRDKIFQLGKTLFNIGENALPGIYGRMDGRWLPDTTKPTLDSRYRGALLGVASGDAVGTGVNYNAPNNVTEMLGGGPFDLKPGEWTDDTSMTLCLAESLLECKGFDLHNQIKYYLRWFDEGYNSCKEYAFDRGGTIKLSFKHYKENPNAYEPHPGAGNGSLMRIAPIPLLYRNNALLAVEMAGAMSRTTHGLEQATDACRYYAGLIFAALNGVDKEELLSANYCPVPGLWEKQPLHPEIAAIAEGEFKQVAPPPIKNNGYVTTSLKTALWGFYHGKDFKDGLLKVVNIGGDTDSTGAIYGSLAGAFYGEESIPENWRQKLAMKDKIQKLSEDLYQLAAQKGAYLTKAETLFLDNFVS